MKGYLTLKEFKRAIKILEANEIKPVNGMYEIPDTESGRQFIAMIDRAEKLPEVPTMKEIEDIL